MAIRTPQSWKLGDFRNRIPRLSAGGKIKAMVDFKEKPEGGIDEPFILALARRPTANEVTGLLPLVSTTPIAPQPYEDIFWALLNSTEFMFNH